MMSGFGGMTGDDQSAGQHPTSHPAAGQPAAGQPAGGQPAAGQPAGGQPAGGQPDSEGTATPESNTGTEGTNPGAGMGAGGYSNIFQL